MAGILSVVLASPTLLVVAISLGFGLILWLFLKRSSSSGGAPKEQVPKRYVPLAAQSEEPRKDKPSTPDRRLAHFRTEEISPIMTPRTLAARGTLTLSGHNPLSGGPLTPRRAGANLRKSTEFAAAPSTPRVIKPAPYTNKSPRKYYTMPASYGEDTKDQPSPTASMSPLSSPVTPTIVTPASPRALDLPTDVAQKLEDVAPTTPRGRAVTEKGFDELWRDAEDQQKRQKEERERVERLKQAIQEEQEKRHAEELRLRQQQLEKETKEFETLFAHAEQTRRATEEEEVLRQKFERLRASVKEHRLQQPEDDPEKALNLAEQLPSASEEPTEPTVRLTPMREKKGKGRRRSKQLVVEEEKVIIADDDGDGAKVIITDDEPAASSTSPPAKEENQTSAQVLT